MAISSCMSRRAVLLRCSDSLRLTFSFEDPNSSGLSGREGRSRRMDGPLVGWSSLSISLRTVEGERCQ